MTSTQLPCREGGGINLCICVCQEREREGERERDALISREMGTFGISGTSQQAHSNIPVAVKEVFPERERGREREREYEGSTQDEPAL